MGELFERISGCLTAVSSEIRQGRVPHGRCSELFEYAAALPDKIRKELGDDKADQLGSTLLSAYDVELAAAKLHQGLQAERERYLAEIDQASGKFRALANLVRL